MAAEIKASADRKTIDVGTPVALFAPKLVTGVGVAAVTPGGIEPPQYAVARDGRFLMNLVAAEWVPYPIAVILNWDANLKK
jgi:hypothetical protein